MKAKYIAHWPGRDTSICEQHRTQMENIAAAMGMPPVSFTKMDESVPPTVCDNCKNDPKTNSIL
jgi:hypothetical protein